MTDKIKDLIIFFVSFFEKKSVVINVLTGMFYEKRKKDRQTNKKTEFAKPTVTENNAATDDNVTLEKTDDIEINGKEKLIEILNQCNIEKGDLLLVHSSMDGLKSLNLTPDEIIDVLMQLIGESGTLVMPAFPFFRSKDGKMVYNHKLKVCNTGLLPTTFLFRPGTIRSKFPYQSLAANGPMAEEMFIHELEDNKSMGKKSAWYYLYQHSAKILFLGSSSIGSNTMVEHMLPDIVGDKWRVKDWYKRKTILCKYEDGETEKEIQFQNYGQCKYYAKTYADNLLRRKKLLRTISVSPSVEIVDNAGTMIDLLLKMFRRGKTLYAFPPKKIKFR